MSDSDDDETEMTKLPIGTRRLDSLSSSSETSVKKLYASDHDSSP